MALVTAPPDEKPVSLDRFRTQARIDATDQDAHLTALLAAATAYLDGWTGVLGRALLTQTWALRLSTWPADGIIDLPLPPVQSVTKVEYIDSTGATVTWSASNYQVDLYSAFPRVVVAPTVALPTLKDDGTINQVIVTFVTGYGSNAENVPEPIRHAIVLLAAHWYERRAASEVAPNIATVPMGFDALIAPYRVPRFGG